MVSRIEPRFSGRDLAELLLIALLYGGLAKLSFLFTIPPGNISPIFPPAGVALAMVLYRGRSVLPAIWLGSFAANTLSFFDGSVSATSHVAPALIVGAIIGLGAATGSWVGAWLVKRFCGEHGPLGSGANVLVLLGLGGLVGCLVSPTLGVLSLALGGYLPWSRFLYSWLTWWAGDSSGAIIAAPFALSLMGGARKTRCVCWEAGMLVGVTLLISYLAFFRSVAMKFGLTPLMLWAAFRFGVRGASGEAVLIALLATVGVSLGHSSFAGETLNESLLNLYLFFGATCLCTLFVAGILEERWRASEELERHHADLERTVAERTADLLQARDRAEAASQAKTAFLASMSHELRTPLNAILGYAQILRRNVDNPEWQDSLQRIHRAGEHLLGLINHVLSISKIEAGRLELDPAPFATAPFFQAIAEMTRLRAEEKGLGFALDIQDSFPEVLVGDALKLRQVLVNLLGNAVKFTERGEVRLVVRRHGPRVGFQVVDTGLGMDSGEVERLFQAFQQARAGERAAEGTGLGLHISQGYVRLMGGEIEVLTEPGCGSSFRFEIPMDEGTSNALAPANARLQLAPHPRLRMLVVDDVEDNRLLLSSLLEAHGLEVRTAQDGATALGQWESWRPDVVWMDLRMPVMDGFETLARMRERERALQLDRTTVLAITASILHLTRAYVVSLGFDDLVGKPVSELEILKMLEHHCGLAIMEGAGGEPVLLEDHLKGLPEDWVRDFERTLVLGDREEAQELVARLGNHALAPVFREMLKDFRFEELRGLLGRCSLGHETSAAS